MNTPQKASIPVIKRLPKYYRYLRSLQADGITSISSRELASQMGTTASQVRQDFNCIGDVNGRQGIGYSVENLLSILESLLFGNGDRLPTILIGCGRLGKAVSRFITTDTNGYKLIAAFDVAENEVGKEISGIRIRHIDELEAFCEENKPKVAVLCVPRDGAQQVSGRLVDLGIEGFWNDMNEPALFYSTDSLENAFETAEKMRHENLGIDGAFKLKDAFVNIANNDEDYRRFYHTVDGQPVRHDKVHNLYGAMMTKSAAEGFRSYNPDRRYLLFSRSSFIGAHRDGGVWQGDNSSWWSHLLLNLKMMPSLNMCGFLYTGADLGGFSCNTTEDLLLRWLALGVFTPLMRNHSAQHTRDQEIFRFRNWEDMRNVVSVRYALLPYLYSLLVKCACRDEMMFRPLAFDYPQDKTAIRVEDQLMLGDECMIAPVVEQNARGRHVYLPEDMLLVRFRSGDDYTVQTMQKGHHWLDVPMNEVPLFIRRGHVIPLCRSAEYVDALDTTKLSLVGWLEVGCAITLYEDDGESTDIDLNEGLQLINVSIDKGVATAKCAGKTIDASKVVVWER